MHRAGDRALLLALGGSLLASAAVCLGCTAPAEQEPVHAARAQQAVTQVGAFGNGLDLVAVSTTNRPTFTGNACLLPSVSTCACDVQWAYEFTSYGGQPSKAAINVANVTVPGGTNTFTAQICKLTSGAPDCSSGNVVASQTGITQGNTGPKWLIFDALSAGSATLGPGERAALVITSRARQTSCTATGDTQSIALPNIGPDVPLGPDGFSDNQLWTTTSGAWAQDPGHEPVFAVTTSFDFGFGPFPFGSGTPYSGGTVTTDNLKDASRTQIINTGFFPFDLVSVGVALTAVAGNPIPATGYLGDDAGNPLFPDGGPGLVFDTNADGGDFWWANLPNGLKLNGGNYRLTLNAYNDNNNKWAWRRDNVANDPKATSTTPDEASYQGSYGSTFGTGPNTPPNGEDYVFQLRAFSCLFPDGGTPPETCGDGLDNDCNGTVDDPNVCPATTSGSSGASSGSGSGSTGAGTTTATTGSSSGSSSGSGSGSGSGSSGSTAASSSSGSSSSGSSASSSSGGTTASSSSSGSGGSSSSSSSSTSSSSGSTSASSSSGSSASSSSGSSSSSSSGSSGSVGSTGTTSTSSSGTSSIGTTGTSSTGTSSTGTSSTTSAATSGGASSGAPGAKGPATFELSGCGCSSLMDPGFGALALLLLGARRRKVRA